jgi:anti-sigma regulatory factor (Ser/Thr protein kinase)
LTAQPEGYRELVPRVEATPRPQNGRNLRVIYDSAFDRADELGRLRAEASTALEDYGRTRGHIRAVILLLSELSTNALMHASPPYRLTLELDDEHTVVNVTDGGDGQASARTPANVDGGYGLNLVNALASTWGAERSARGKTVWAAIGRSLTL